MNRRCSQPSCNTPEVSCTLGELDFERCEHWRSSSAVSESAGADDGQEEEGTRLPWTGNAFGATDVMFVAGRSSARLVAVLGAESAGKTSLLAAWYLLIHRGHRPGHLAFAGSYTLEGWENIAASLRWSTPKGPAFPAHTSSGTGRHPGLMHLAMKKSDGTRLDLLFADAPGEWFTRWAVNRNAPDAKGAQWLSETADVLVVVADSDALSGPERGGARSRLLELIHRVGAERQGRSTALVWSKSDKEVSSSIVSAVRAAADDSLGQHEEFHVSLHSGNANAPDQQRNVGQGLLELFAWVASVQGQPYRFAQPREPDSADPIMMYGRSYA